MAMINTNMRWAIILLLLFGASFAAGTDVFLLIFPFAVIIVAIILALLRMAADTFSLPGLSAYVKTELGELFAGVILALIVYAFIISSDQLSTLLTGQSATMLAESHFESLVTQYYIPTFLGIIRIGTQLKAMISFSTNQAIPALWMSWGWTISSYGGLSPLLSSLTMAVQGLSNSILLYESVLLLLRFSSAIIPTIVLPLALSLRLIPFTRQAGTALTAICISVLVIFPWSVVFVDQIHSQDVVPYPNPVAGGAVGRIISNLGINFPSSEVLEFLCQNHAFRFFLQLNELGWVGVLCPPTCLAIAASVCAGTGPGYAACFGAAFWACFETCFWLIVLVDYPVTVLGAQLIYNTIGTSFINVSSSQAGSIFDAMYPFMAAVNNLVMMGYVDAIIIGVFTIVGARAVSAALGGEWSMIRFQRLV